MQSGYMCMYTMLCKSLVEFVFPQQFDTGAKGLFLFCFVCFLLTNFLYIFIYIFYIHESLKKKEKKEGKKGENFFFYTS